MDKQRNLEMMEHEQIGLLKKKLHEKTTYLKPLRYLFDEHLPGNALFLTL